MKNVPHNSMLQWQSDARFLRLGQRGRLARGQGLGLLDPCTLPLWLVLASQACLYFEVLSSSAQLGLLLREGETNFLSSAVNTLLLCVLAANFLQRFWKTTNLQRAYLAVLGLAFAYNAFISFSPQAACWAFAKYLVPVLALFHGYIYRDRLPQLLRAFLVLVLANDAFQCVNYAFYLTGNTTLYYQVEGNVIRAGGLCGAVGFGAMNLFAAILADRLLKNTKLAFLLFAFALSAITLKVWAIVLVYVLARIAHNRRYQVGLLCIVALVGVPAAIALGTSGLSAISDEMLTRATERIDAYVVHQESARNESYRVMWESLTGGNLFGEGLGYFGGPASIRYDSPAYWDYDFQWHDTGLLVTTDTYYPHLFVEMGLLGGLWYLAMFFLPWFASRHRSVSPHRRRAYLWLVGILFWDSVASFAIQDITYAFSSTVFLYGLAATNVPAEVTGLRAQVWPSVTRWNRSPMHRRWQKGCAE